MLGAPESVAVKIRVSWLGNAGAFSSSVLLGSLCGKLSWGHFLQKTNIRKVSLQGNAILKQSLATTAYDPFRV